MIFALVIVVLVGCAVVVFIPTRADHPMRYSLFGEPAIVKWVALALVVAGLIWWHRH